MTDHRDPILTVPSYKRMRFSDITSHTADVGTPFPAPAYADDGIRRTKSSIPIRVIRRLTLRHEETPDPTTIPVFSKKELRKAEKREQRKLEELQAYQRKQFHDQISRQLAVNRSEREVQHSQSLTKRSVKDKVRYTLRLTKKSSKKSKAQEAPVPTPEAQSLPVPQYPPHVDDFQNKNELRNWFHPSDVEAAAEAGPVGPPTEFFPAELPAMDIASPVFPSLGSDLTKTHFVDTLDIETLPPPIRSPSPCLSSIPRRGITLTETTTISSSKQMQCDYCHGPIKLTGFHYACNLCNDGDCIYCAKCANEGRTCRHELVECARNIKRHPTNPHHSDRKSLSLEKDSMLSDHSVRSSQSIELSAASAVKPDLPQIQTNIQNNEASSSKTKKERQSPSIPATPEDLFREFEAKRREQEIAFREKEVTLREREAMLREREAWTAARERDAALVQQLHAAAMLQQSSEVGSQFQSCSPISRQSSCCSAVSRRPSHPHADPNQAARTDSRAHHRLSQMANDPLITLHATSKGKKRDTELASSVAALEASIAGIDINESGIRSHANSQKRKSASTECQPSPSALPNRRSHSQARRSSSRKSNDDFEDDEEENGSDDGSPKRQKQEASEPQKLFACPYFKHDPVRYAEGNTGELNYRSCAGGLYRDISRVKQHLKRVHHRPDFYCRRCFESFNSNERLQKHSSAKQGCDVKECPYPEKLDETQQGKIHVKRPGKDPKELWLEIYSIIFPDHPLPDSPYIEQAQSKPISNGDSLELFVELFNQKLNMASSLYPWLTSQATRDFLNSQMLQTIQDLRSFPTSGPPSNGVPSVLVSPVSPPSMGDMHFSTTQRSAHSSRTSSSNSQYLPTNHARRSSMRQPTPVSPVNHAEGLRPALKVTTSGMGSNPSSTNSQSNSARSQQNLSFPRIPTHVQEDAGYDVPCESWVSGDDSYAMVDMPMHEPSSATSTRSIKSVSFAPHPQRWTPPPNEMQQRAPTLFDFTSFDWTTENFAPDVLGAPRTKHTGLRRVDSAYGTLSSAQASKTSLLQPQTQSHSNNSSQEMLTCVDPQVLYVNPSDVVPMTPGVSADLQAYLNRNTGRHF